MSDDSGRRDTFTGVKKLLLLAGVVAAVAAVVKNLQDQQAERDLWAEATDQVSG